MQSSEEEVGNKAFFSYVLEILVDRKSYAHIDRICMVIKLTELFVFFDLLPLGAAALTLLSILVIRVIFSVLPVLRLLYAPPAKLASQHDF